MRLIRGPAFVDSGGRLGRGPSTNKSRTARGASALRATRLEIRAPARVREDPGGGRSDAYFLQGAVPLTDTVCAAPPVIGAATNDVEYGRLPFLQATDAIEVLPLDD
jgi:hypothetical protein